MIFFQPIILAGEFITHAVSIVIAGIICVEYIICAREKGGAEKKRPLLILISMAAIGLALLLFEFFIGRGEIWMRIFIYWPLLGVLIYLTFIHRRASAHHASPVYFYLAVGATVVLIAISIVYVLAPVRLLVLASVLGRVAVVIVFYFYVLSSLIASDKKS